MPFSIIRNDITKVKADIIVNTANPNPIIGSGIDYAIYNAAGRNELLAEREKIGKIKRGDIAVTPAFNLNAKYIIHAVGSRWHGGKHGEIETVRSCYAKSLSFAHDISAKSIAFPLLSSGNYGFPKSIALNIALSEIGRFLLTNEMKVILVVFDDTSFRLSKKVTNDVSELIDSDTVTAVECFEYDWEIDMSYIREIKQLIEIKRISQQQTVKPEISLWDFVESNSLEEAINNVDEGFREYLFKLIDKSKLDEKIVYKRANLDRRLFSQIRRNAEYKPKKTTVVALAIGLQLDEETMVKLIAKAGYSFTRSDKFDIIIAYFVHKKIYDINLINWALLECGQPILGSQS